MTQAKAGSKVSLKFTGTLKDGNTFGRATPDEPLTFTIGNGEILEGVEEAIIGMSPGESKKTTLPPDKAFGPRKDNRVIRINREEIPASLETDIGKKINLTTPQGESIPAQVIEKTDTEVVVDANHPLAGEELTFELELLEVK